MPSSKKNPIAIAASDQKQLRAIHDAASSVYDSVLAEIAETKPFFTSAGNSSEYHGWETPPALAQLLTEIVGGFDLDPCAATKDILAARVKAKVLLTVDDDGLKADWSGIVFCNPPYGRSLPRWVRKCATEAENGATIVALIPARTCTRWWHDHVRFADVFLLKGRLKFGDGRNSAPFPSALVVWNGDPKLVQRLAAAIPNAWHVPRSRTFAADIRSEGPSIQVLATEWSRLFRGHAIFARACAAS